MTREVDLVSYLPPFLAEFKEIAVALEAENPEFVLVWDAAERVLQNEFIETADEYGIARFEKILNILPSTEDTLESRRVRVQSHWFGTTPYTLSQIRDMLETLCGSGNCSVALVSNEYTLVVKIALAAKSNYTDVKALLERVVPVNMVIDLRQLYNTHAQLSIFTHAQLRNEVMH